MVVIVIIVIIVNMYVRCANYVCLNECRYLVYLPGLYCNIYYNILPYAMQHNICILY